jgi:hypothetical protein
LCIPVYCDPEAGGADECRFGSLTRCSRGGATDAARSAALCLLQHSGHLHSTVRPPPGNSLRVRRQPDVALMSVSFVFVSGGSVPQPMQVGCSTMRLSSYNFGDKVVSITLTGPSRSVQRARSLSRKLIAAGRSFLGLRPRSAPPICTDTGSRRDDATKSSDRTTLAGWAERGHARLLLPCAPSRRATRSPWGRSCTPDRAAASERPPQVSTRTTRASRAQPTHPGRSRQRSRSSVPGTGRKWPQAARRQSDAKRESSSEQGSGLNRTCFK